MAKTFIFLVIVAALVAGFHPEANAQGAAFTYQGKLDESGGPANGYYDLVFSLWTAPSGAAQVGGVLSNSAVAVSNGLFVVTLDFGANFPGSDRWLEVTVRKTGSPTAVVLAPRQKITPAPYAITALNVQAGSAGLAGNYSGVITMTNSLDSFAGTFRGNGAGLTNLPRAGEVLVARAFGAVGNGVADDTAALQAAIDAASEQTNSSAASPASGQTELWLEAGLYRTTAPLWIRGKNGLKISGLGGPGQCVITNTASDLFIITNAANAWSQEPNALVFQGLSLRSSGYAWTGLRFCARVNTTDDVLVRDCRFSGFDKAVLAVGDGGLGGVSNSRFENLNVFDNHYGLMATNGLFNANQVEGMFVGNYGSSLVIDSGTWDISLRDSGGIVNSTPTTNILWITGTPKIILRGGQSEYYGAPNAAAILATGTGGYDLLCDGVTLVDFTGSRPWSGNCWSVDLEDAGSFTSFVHFHDCRFSVANKNYTGSPFVKITHCDVQRVTAIGPRVMAGYFFFNTMFNNFALQADPLCILDVSGSIVAQGAINWGYKVWLATNNIPKWFMSVPGGMLRLDSSDTFNADNLTSGTVADALLTTNVAMLGNSQTFAGNISFATNVIVGGMLGTAPLTASPGNGSTITPASSYLRLVPANGTVTLNATTPIAAGTAPGAILVLEGTSDASPVIVPNAPHVRLAGGASRSLGARDALTLIWNGTDWIELSFSNN
ncbi:MAG: glycosyl hydrolase family 28-related protein [Verrucomicrobiota bacterium]